MITRKIIQGAFLLLLTTTLISCAKYNAPCEVDNDCTKIYTDSYKCYDKHCMRKHFTYSAKEVTGWFVVIGIAMIANAGGLGAGAVIIPIYMYFYDFVATDAIPLSKITIFAGAVINMFFNWDNRHIHNKNRFLINYNVATVMIPLLLAGTTIGVILSKFLPSVVISLSLMLYIVLSLLKLYKRGIKLHRKEVKDKLLGNSIDAQEMKVSESFSDLNQSEMTLDDIGQDLEETLEEDAAQQSIENANEVSQIGLEARLTTLDDELKPTSALVKIQRGNFFMMIISYCVILVAALVRGGEGKPSILGIKKCTGESWITLLAAQFLCFFIASTAYRVNKAQLKADDQISDDGDTPEEKADKRKQLLIASYFTGTAAGTLGIGGGMIMGPFMLALNMDPQISTALSAFTVLFTSSSTTLQFTIAGAIHFEHAWLFMTLSLIGSIIGNFGLRALIRHYKKPSLLVWIIFGVLAMAGLVLPGQMAVSALSGHKGLLEFGEIC